MEFYRFSIITESAHLIRVYNYCMDALFTDWMQNREQNETETT